jgi:hypothetical protein
VFLTLMVIGLVGLVMMAVPAFGGHHHLPQMRLHGHGAGIGHQGHVGELGRATAATNHLGLRFLPSPRTLFSLCALYGAFGNALVHAAHLSRGSAALLAIGPALLTEWILIRPIWKLLFRAQGDPSRPLEELVLSEAHAVVPFRNGRGLVTTVRDGRRIQLSARLSDEQASLPVAVGQRVRIEDVDARRECVTVSLLSNDHPPENPT